MPKKILAGVFCAVLMAVLISQCGLLSSKGGGNGWTRTNTDFKINEHFEKIRYHCDGSFSRVGSFDQG